MSTFIQKYTDIPKYNALDLGCGNGRNSIFLAENGFKSILGIDLAQSAIDIGTEEIHQRKLDSKIDLIQGDIIEELEEITEQFDLIVDAMVIHTLNSTERAKLIGKVKELLAPDGYFVLSTISLDNDYAQMMVSKFPGKEKNSYQFEHKGFMVIEQAFSKDELIKMFGPLDLVETETASQTVNAFGTTYTREYFYMFFKHPEITNLSYLMGGGDITDEELSTLNIKIVDKTESGSRKLKIPKESLEQYKSIVRQKLTPGFWNDILTPEKVIFIFKHENGQVEEVDLAEKNKTKIAKLCSAFNGDPIEKTSKIYEYLAGNEFYSEFLKKWFSEVPS